MKTIKVVAAVICDNMKEKNKIFATARGYGELKGGWEFPGGKIEAGETPQEALKREIMEELDTEIKVGDLIDTIEYDYPTFHLSMDCFWAEVTAGHLELKEAEAAKWLTKDQQRCLVTGRYHFDRENSKEHGELISNIIFRGIAMIYTVKRIDEDLDFGCEERPKGMPVMAIVTLTNSSGEEIRIKAEDAMLYECNINEGDKVCFDVNNKLEKVALPN